jgi:uncharacterized protein
LKRILVLSDLHIPTRLKKFPYEKVNKYIKDVDFIFGLGDYNTQEGLQYLYSYGKEVFAVSGNMDEYSITYNLPDKMIVNIEEFEIGLIHGWGSHSGIREKIIRRFDKIDLICYGHTHESFFGKENGINFFNPGSLCGTNASFGILSIDKKKIKAEIIKIA